MIIYLTKKTIERYDVAMPVDIMNPVMRSAILNTCRNEKGNQLLEWGAKLFYFDHRKCLQLCNFASKLTIVLVDIKKADIDNVGQYIVEYIRDIYSDDKRMTDLLKRWFKEHPIVCFDKITDQRIIGTMNRFQRLYLEDGYRLYEFIDNGGVLRTFELNRKINKDYVMTKTIAGKKEYFFPVEKFAELLKEYYK